MKEISPSELAALRQKGLPHLLLDVREDEEYDFVNISGLHIPMAEVPQRLQELNPSQKIVVMCRSGKRSAQVAQFLASQPGFTEVYNLRGGILAYADEVDPALPRY